MPKIARRHPKRERFPLWYQPCKWHLTRRRAQWWICYKLPPDPNFFWPEYENSCIFRASCHKDVLVFMLFYHRKKFQSWGVRAERSREGLRSAHLLGSCASGMAGSKILTHMPKTTGHAPSGHKTEWPPNSASFSLGSASKVTWPILRLLSTHISKRERASRVPHWS